MFDEKIVKFVNMCYSDIGKAEDILKNEPSIVFQSTSIDETPLTLLMRWYSEDVATKEQYVHALNLFLDYGADVNTNNGCGINPLHLAVLSGDIDIVKILISNNADINISDGFLGQTTLGCAISSGNIAMAKYLVGNGVDIDAVDDFSQTALHLVSESDENIEFTKLLISCGVNLDAIDGGGNTPLHNSCYENAQITTIFLIENGANMYIKNERGIIPMDIAYKEGNLDLYDKLIDMVS